MAEKDIAQKTLEAYNDVFADIVNVLLFDGKRLVREDDLSDMTTTSQYKIDKKLHEQERDVAKFWHQAQVRIAIYGLENQTNIDPDMPLRILSYDGAAYRDQLNHPQKDEKGHILRYPVVTMVLYFGEDPWNKPKRLLERLKVPEALKPYVSDYKINVFEICRLSDEQVNLFTSDFKIVADYFVQMYRNQDYQPSSDTIRHVREVFNLLSILTENHNLEDKFNEIHFDRKDGEVNMEAAWQKVMDQNYNEGFSNGMTRGRNEGISIGRNEGISIGCNETLNKLLSQGIITKEQAAQFQS